MASVIQNNFRVRKSYAKIPKIIDIPNLIDIQRQSYEKFLQRDVSADKREDVGLQGVFRSVFPIKDFAGTCHLEFVSYQLEKAKYSSDECRQRGMTYAASVRVVMRLVIWDVNEETGQQSIRDVKEQEVYFGELPLMTESGTFIINGTERVVVSQLHRSPGVFFDHDRGKTHSSGKLLYNARIIPYRGSWLDFEFDPKDILYVRIDRRRKLHATILLRAMGYSTEELLSYFYTTETIFIEETDGVRSFSKSIEFDSLPGQRAIRDIYHPITGEILVKKNRKFTRSAMRKLQDSGVRVLAVGSDEVVGKISARDVVDEHTGEVLLQCNEQLTEAKIATLAARGIREIKVLFIDGLNVGSYLRDTLIADKVNTPDEALIEIYRRMRPGDPPTIEASRSLFNNLFFNPERYDLSKVGRLKLNFKFQLNESIETAILTKRDILETVRYLIDLKNGVGSVDDIDHLGNRRVRAVGELMENQYRVGLVRMERAIKERMSMSQEIETLMPHDLINSKPVSAVVKEYFGGSQLSQFMDQTNPLSEITHKRRLSALGPGGLTRERAGFEVRDVHATHYGRICPIETPEGPNIGLIASLSTYARVNEFGFIETPYRKVENRTVTDRVEFYSALQEEGHFIAQAKEPVDAEGRLVAAMTSTRHNRDVVLARTEDVGLMDVSPNQLVSIAASLIPFLEHDDANRALMGSNMQRQAVPLVRSSAPLVGTGVEGVVARDSSAAVVAKREGVVEEVDASRIVIRPVVADDPNELVARSDMYPLMKFQRSNQSTCINQKPIVRPGDRVRAGDVIADGPACESGELALGQNVVVSFMPWGGYNFEDSILCSERLVRQDSYTSIHIEEFECIARDTKLGKEEITSDIPNVGEEALKDLDSSGIVRIGAEVSPQDILVGKVTPKGETQLSPEEKLLRAIFGEKASDVKDTSLRVPPGVQGIVIYTKVFSRKGIEKDEQIALLDQAEKERFLQEKKEEIRRITRSYEIKMRQLLQGRETVARLVDEKGKVVLAKGTLLTEEVMQDLPLRLYAQIRLKDESVESRLEVLFGQFQDDIKAVESQYEDRIAKLEKGDELPPGVIKVVKVYVAIKRKLSVGDKMAGRHGNKGVVSRILPEEDMPYLTDGTPVDMVLNPLGVPSRMNVGQILETHLGRAALGLGQSIQRMLEGVIDFNKLRTHLKNIYNTKQAHMFLDALDQEDLRLFALKLCQGVHVATPVFDGADETEIRDALRLAGLPEHGQAILFDGKTGQVFEHPVTVGVMYMMKLHHLVDDKIHARSIGPYSLVTQQPLGGKAQFGGQRLGEMEVWAMEAYGAAYALQEFLTVKSDDVSGRTKMYESIVKGDYTLQVGLPESFHVLLKEMQSLCLSVELINNQPSTHHAIQS